MPVCENSRADALNTAKAKPILITGSHRSGSTWAGRMVAHSPAVGYIHEPFHVGQRNGVCNGPFTNWFTYVCEENEAGYLEAIRDCLAFRYHALDELQALDSFKSGVRLVRDFARFTAYQWFKKRPLLKDPIAIFSAEWLAKRFDMHVVVLVRHPAAFAGSLKQADWSFPFNHLLNQPLLMQHHLQPFVAEINECEKTETDIVDQAVLLWNIIHHVILKYHQQHAADWLFVRHEDLSRRPLDEFRSVYERLGLIFSKQIQQQIAKYSLTTRKLGGSAAGLQRHSESNVSTWKTRLTADEIQRVKSGTQVIASEFYDEQDWNI